MTAPSEHVLICGVSTRAAAASAARAGFTVTALDAFADLDQHPSVRAMSVPRERGRAFTARTASRVARGIPADAVAYLSSFENHPSAVAALASGRALWGNSPDVLRRVRDPRQVAAALRERGLPSPALASDPAERLQPLEWLLKPVASGGGHRVRRWRVRGSNGTVGKVPRGFYAQELIDGLPGSVVFVAAGGRATVLGVSRQLVGEAAFGAGGYRYSGNILAVGHGLFEHDEQIIQTSRALADAIAEAFGLIGVNGIDFVARDGVPYAIEVNPRWCSSMELVERACGLSLFGAHAAACRAGELPEADLASTMRNREAVGKAVVFARHDVTVGDTLPWLSDDDIRDVPHPGEKIDAGRPVCTVFARAEDAAGCQAALTERAARIYVALARWTRDAA